MIKISEIGKAHNRWAILSIIFTIFFLAMILIIISFTFTFCPLLQLLQFFKSFGQTGFASGKIPTVLKSSGEIPTVLKSYRNLVIIWKTPHSFETVRKMGNDPEKKDGFETFRKMVNDLEKSVQS